MLEINGKQFRNLAEQVAYLTQCYAQGVVINTNEKIASVNQLPPATSVMEGYTVAVGSNQPFQYYLSSNGSWVNLGTFPAKGDKGDAGQDGYCLFITSEAVNSSASQLQISLFYNPENITPVPGDVVLGGADMNIFTITSVASGVANVEWRGRFKGEKGDKGDINVINIEDGTGTGSIKTSSATAAAGTNSVAIGPGTNAQRAGQIVIGKYNDTGVAAILFGTGSSDQDRATEITIDNGEVVINGELVFGDLTGPAKISGLKYIDLNNTNIVDFVTNNRVTIHKSTFIDGSLTLDGGFLALDPVSFRDTVTIRDGTLFITDEDNTPVIIFGLTQSTIKTNTRIEGNLEVTGTFPEPTNYVKNVSSASSQTTFTKNDNSTIVLNASNGSGTSSLRLCNSGSVSGGNAIAIGAQSTSSASYGFAQGYGSKVSGSYSVAMGNHSEAGASGITSCVAMGSYVTSKTQSGKFVCGKYNADTAGNIFEVGIGESGDPENGMALSTYGRLYAKTTTTQGLVVEETGGGNGHINIVDGNLIMASTGQIQIGSDYYAPTTVNIGGTNYTILAKQ